ncbi:hypothetical protein DRO55_01975 [Candidatus Bathyarchaeota archaeon]|nr:MAG: hypothetical protein DRO55_01975 [Candidatus Bathyarchaeota archaeon]
MLKGLDKTILNDAKRIVDEADKRGVILRIMGALAIYIHSGEFVNLYRRMGRLGDRLFTDIDLIGYSKQRKDISEVLNGLGYDMDRAIMLMFGANRGVWHHPDGLYHVDVFFDALEFSHDIRFNKGMSKGRLELDYPTLTPSDLLLEKTQIHEINEKDIKDIIVLVRAHEISEDEKKDTINVKYIARLLADDWGFYYDVKENLNKVLFFAEKYFKENLISEQDFSDIKVKINKILECMHNEPKTKKWKKRAKKGTKKKWWRDVEEYLR